MKTGTTITWIKRTAGFFAVLAILLCAGFYVWIHSRSGMDWLAATIQAITKNSVQIDGLSGRLPHRLHAGQLRLLDDDNVIWLTADNIHAQLSVPMLIKKKVFIQAAHADEVTMSEVPRYDPSTKTNTTAASTFITSVHVQNGTINMFTMNTNVSVIGIAGPVTGSLVWQPDGTISAKARSSLLLNGDISLEVSGRMEMSNRHIDFKDIIVTNGRNHASFSGYAALASDEFKLDGKFELFDLIQFASILQKPVSGQLSGSTSLSRVNRNEPWVLDFEAHADHLQYADYSARDIGSEGHLSFTDSDLQYECDASAEAVSIHGLTLRQNRMHGRGNRSEHRLTAHVSGWQTEETSTVFQAAAELAIIDGIMDVFNLNVGNIDMQAWSRVISTNLPSMFGSAQFNAGWTNSTGNSSGLAVLKTGQVRIENEVFKHFEDSRFTVTANLDHEFIRLHGVATHPLLDVFKLEARTPVVKTNAFIPFALHQLERMEARLKIAGNLREIGDSMLTSPVAIGGLVQLDMNVTDPMGTPNFDGSFALTNGQFRSVEAGTFLDRIELVVTGIANRLHISNASATDGGRGLISASGDVTLTRGWKPDFNIHGVLTNASLFRIVRTDLPLSGDLRAVSSNQTILISGDLWLEPFRFAIPRRLPPNIPTLQVIEINHPDSVLRSQSSTPSRRPPESMAWAAIFDIAIKTRNSFVVSGRGLNSVWRGDMKLRGTIDQPRLTGLIKIVEGHAMLLGRRFNIDDGAIQLNGEIPPNPSILVSASTRIGNTVTRLVAIGNIEHPQVDLTSDPLLPKDEIMALILFGKEIDTMSPWQAIALANGLRTLSGSGDLVNVIDRSQSIIQIDQIDIRQDEEGEGFSSIAVGKYIGRNLYIEGERGFGNAADSITVTLELTPNLILQTEASPQIREGIGLYWRREY